ncbi:MAG: hypothetical protein MUF47_08950 [Porphyrobacter sp.]|jgi:hypothetical protein|nr:hypothetical protein [Porphyrobacter sp.]
MNSILDGILKNIGGAPDDVAGLSAKVGLDPALVEKGLAALSQTVAAPGDTVDLAAQHSGIAKDALAKVVEQLGGEGALGQIASQFGQNPDDLMKLVDRDGDGNPINDVMNMAKGLFGKS